jgi:hypothetical protein
MSGNKSGSQCQLNGFTGDAGGNRLKKDTLSGRDLVPFFSDSESAVKSEKQIVNSSVKAKVIRANGAPVPFPLLPTPYQFMPRSGSPPPAVSSRRVHHPEGLYAGTTLDTPPSPWDLHTFAFRFFSLHFADQIRRSLTEFLELCCISAKATSIKLRKSSKFIAKWQWQCAFSKRLKLQSDRPFEAVFGEAGASPLAVATRIACFAELHLQFGNYLMKCPIIFWSPMQGLVVTTSQRSLVANRPNVFLPKMAGWVPT